MTSSGTPVSLAAATACSVIVAANGCVASTTAFADQIYIAK
jgi:hypothetical protein